MKELGMSSAKCGTTLLLSLVAQPLTLKFLV